MRYEDMPCQHSGKIGSCQECADLKLAVAKIFKAKSDKISQAVAQGLAADVQVNGLKAALEHVVEHVTYLQGALSAVAYGYMDCLTMIARSEDLDQAKICVAVMSMAGEVLPEAVVDREIVERLDAECVEQGLYEKLAQAKRTEGARGAAFLREIK